jgi:hypothetical protein
LGFLLGSAETAAGGGGAPVSDRGLSSSGAGAPGLPLAGEFSTLYLFLNYLHSIIAFMFTCSQFLRLSVISYNNAYEKALGWLVSNF